MEPNSPLYITAWLLVYFLFVVFFFYAVLSFILATKRKRSEQKHQYELTFLQIKLPDDNELEVKVAESMFSSLAGFRKGFFKSLWTGQYRISFEIVSKNTGIGFYIGVPDEIASIVEKQINAAYPCAEIDIINPQEVWDRGNYTSVTELKLKGQSFYPIKVYEDIKNDSLSSITNSMSKLKDTEVLAVQYVISPASDNWRRAGTKFVNGVKAKASNPDKKVNIDTSFLEAIDKKLGHPGFDVKIRIIGISDDSLAAKSLTQNLLASFELFTDTRYNRFVPTKPFFIQNLIDDFIYRRLHVREFHIPLFDITLYRDTSVLNTVELATIFHFPNKDIATPNILWLGARRSSAPTNTPAEGLFLGRSKFRGVDKKIFMKTDDRRRHFYIIGQTGTGKSVFMMTLVLQDIKNGEGVAVIDPHGSDVQELLEKIPPERIDDVILFDAADTERPMGINMLEASSEEEKHQIINSFIALLYKLYDPNHQGIMGPMLERTIRNVMLTAMSDPQATMVDVMRMIIDEDYSKKFIDKLEDPMVKRFWTDEMAKTTANRKGENMGYFVSKFDRFVTERTMRNILSQPKSSFNFHDVMAQKKILLVDLAKGKIGEENSNFIGLMLVPRILAAALARHKYIGKQDFPDFFLYVDEFQNFATPDFATIFSEARKYKLNLTVAHQFVAQLDEKIKDAVFGNIGTMTSFRVGTEDAEFLENYFGPKFTKRDLSKLPVGNCYTRLLVDGHPTEPFSMNIDIDEIRKEKKDKNVAEKIKENSRMKYGVPAEEIQKYVESRMGFDEPKDTLDLPKIPMNKIPF